MLYIEQPTGCKKVENLQKYAPCGHTEPVQKMVRLIDIFQLQDLKSGGDPARTAWIAARFDQDQNLPNEFRLGDGAKHGTQEYVNRPLLENQSYKVFVRAYTSNSVSN